jgi:hypothetical protein
MGAKMIDWESVDKKMQSAIGIDKLGGKGSGRAYLPYAQWDGKNSGWDKYAPRKSRGAVKVFAWMALGAFLYMLTCG